MIVLRRASHFFQADDGKRLVLAPTTLVIPAERRIALLSTSQHDVGILIDLLTGTEKPKVGSIERTGTVSFQVGYLGGFEKSLTVAQNLIHVARLYGMDVVPFIAFVHRLIGDQKLFERKFKFVPAEARRRLGSIIGYALPFDTYVVNLGKNGARLQTRDTLVHALFEARIATSGFIVATLDTKFAQTYCVSALVFHDGQLELHDDIAEGIARFHAICEEIELPV